MENASKALIIAGAIILAILIIGLGMFIYQKAAGAMNTDSIDAAKVDAYNAKFERYKGIITGSDARTLCNTITSHNRNTAEDSSQFVKITVGDENTDVSNDTTNGAGADDSAATFNATLSNAIASIRAGYSYKVTYGYEPGSGLIISVGLAKQNK